MEIRYVYSADIVDIRYVWRSGMCRVQTSVDIRYVWRSGM